MNKQKLTFYFDYISPYSYLAWHKISILCEKYNLELKPEPIVFGAILTKLENKGPAEVEPKRIFLYKDVLRSANKDNILLKFPPAHPFNPLLALRATCIMEKTTNYNNFITDIFDACWKEGKDISNIELIDSFLKKYNINNGIEFCNNDEIKNILKEKTTLAINNGIFGVPSMLINEELFWGNDRFDFLENYILGKDPINLEEEKN